MTAKDDPGTPGDASTLDRDLFGTAAVATKPEGEGRTRQAKEPQLRALRRILGDTVLDMFPPNLMDSVEKAFKHWQGHPDSFLVSAFDTETEKDDSLTVMRAYAECAGEKGYTVYTETGPAPEVLHWRVQTRRGTKATD